MRRAVLVAMASVLVAGVLGFVGWKGLETWPSNDWLVVFGCIGYLWYVYIGILLVFKVNTALRRRERGTDTVRQRLARRT